MNRASPALSVAALLAAQDQLRQVDRVEAEASFAEEHSIVELLGREPLGLKLVRISLRTVVAI